MSNLETIKCSEVQIGDYIFGKFEVTGISKSDHFGKPALQFTFGQRGRMILLLNESISVSN